MEPGAVVDGGEAEFGRDEGGGGAEDDTVVAGEGYRSAWIGSALELELNGGDVADADEGMVGISGWCPWRCEAEATREDV